MLTAKSKVYIVGTSGAGKSTLARRIAEKFNLADLELDAFHWGPNWTPKPLTEFCEQVERAVAKDGGWVVHGNYSQVQDLVLKRADTVVWLDYPLPVILWRVTKRSVLRIVKRHELWAGNRETFRQTFLSKHSIILWALQTYKRRKHQYEALRRDPRYSQIQFICLKTPREADQWLSRS